MDMVPSKKGGEEENARRGASGRPHPNFQVPNGEAAAAEEKSPSKGSKKGAVGYVLKDAPWSAGGRGGDHKNAPDIGSSHDFPAFLPGQFAVELVQGGLGAFQVPPFVAEPCKAGEFLGIGAGGAIFGHAGP